jgi:hypothetical protein
MAAALDARAGGTDEPFRRSPQTCATPWLYVLELQTAGLLRVSDPRVRSTASIWCVLHACRFIVRDRAFVEHRGIRGPSRSR